MNSFLKMVFAAAMTLVLNVAAAQVHGTYQYANYRWYAPPQQVVLVQPAQQTSVSGSGGGLNGCQVLGGLGGAVLGQEARNHPNAASVVLAFLGVGLGGHLCGDGNRRVYVPEGQYRPAGNVVLSRCEIDDLVVEGLKNNDQCKALAAKLATKKEVSPEKTYGKDPTTANGHTCSVLNKAGEVLADFLDAKKNPKGVVVKTGAECIEERQLFASRR